MKTLDVLIGSPGAGKTTLCQKWGIFTVCPDSIREMFGIDPADKSRNHEVWDYAKALVRVGFEYHGTVVLDATNLDAKLRDEFIRAVCPRDTFKVAIIVWAPLEVCQERNLNRSRKVDPSVIDRYYGFFLAEISKFNRSDCGFEEINYVLSI